MNTSEAGALESVAGTTTVYTFTATNADGTAMNLTSTAISMYVGATVGVSPPVTGTPTYSTASGAGITITSPTLGAFTVQTSASVDATAGFYRYILLVTPAGGATTVLAHGIYAVAQP